MRSVELAYPYTDPAGKRHAADSVIHLDDTAAVELIAAGRAREPKQQPAARSTITSTEKNEGK